MCKVLPAYHDFTGDDYEAAFNRKGKVNPLKLLIEDQQSMDAFGMLGHSESLSHDLINGISRFVCRMYSTVNTRDQTDCVNKKRYLSLLSKIPKKGKNIIKKLKSFDPTTMPPCRDALTQKIRRVNLITHLKINSHLRVIPCWDPVLHGWTIEDNKLVPVWFLGDRVPEELYHEDDETDDDDDEEEEEKKEDEDETNSDSESDSDDDERFYE